jgi:hypothetical protein
MMVSESPVNTKAVRVIRKNAEEQKVLLELNKYTFEARHVYCSAALDSCRQ